MRDRGTTVVLVTHFMDEAESLCDRVAVMDDGRIVACDTRRALTARQGGPVTITFGAAALAEQGVTPGDYRTRYPSLEDVFLSLTGRSLSEGDG